MASTSMSSVATPMPQGLALSISTVLDPPEQAVASTSRSPPSSSLSLTQSLAQRFATPESLSQDSIDGVQAALRKRLAQVDEETDAMIRQLGHHHSNPALTESGEIQSSMRQLFARINTIREKAAASESTVKEITGDIRSLDTAKHNLVSSMTALRRLQMLESGADRLDTLTGQNNFREAAQALQAVKELQASFKSYMGVERVSTVWRRVADSQQVLKTAAMEEYEKFFLQSNGVTSIRETLVPEAALALDAIGSEAITSLLDWYCSLQLREYRRIFRATDEAGQLDNVSRRFAWFRRVIKQHDEEHEVAFPEPWQAPRALTARFSDITREDVKSVLVRERAKLQVGTLLEALQATMEFELQSSKRFAAPFEEIMSSNPKPPTAGSTGPSGISVVTSSQTTAKNIASVFEQYLGLYVEAQDKALADLLANFRREGASIPDTAQQQTAGADAQPTQSQQHHTVLPSSTELFYFYRQRLEQCLRFSNREPFRDLCNVFARYLRAYADEVLRASLLARPESTGRRSTSTDTRTSTQELVKWCLILNTADYCANTCQQLEQRLKDKIHEDYKDDITLEPNRELFAAIVSAAIQMLTREVELAADSALQRMARPNAGSAVAPWAQADEAQGKSAYIDDVHSALESIAVIVRQDIEAKRYVRTWSDRVVVVLTLRFIHGIVRLRPINKAKAEQLLVDLYEIKSMLLELPQYTPSESSSTLGSSYVRHVERSVGRAESLLRATMIELASSDAAGREAFVREYVEKVGDRSLSNFQKILELKGLAAAGVARRQAQTPQQQQDSANAHALVDCFMAVTDTLAPEEAAETSFLTALDMEPSGAILTALPTVDFSAYDSRMASNLPAAEGQGTATPPWLGYAVRSPDRAGARSPLGGADSSNTMAGGASSLMATGLGLVGGAGSAGNTGGTNTPTAGSGRVFGAGGKFGSLFGGLGMKRDDNRSR